MRRKPKENSIHFVRQCFCREAGEPAGAGVCPRSTAILSQLPPGLETRIFLAVLWWDAAGEASPALTARSLPGVRSSLSRGDVGKAARDGVGSAGTRTSLRLRFGMGTHGCTCDTLSLQLQNQD